MDVPLISAVGIQCNLMLLNIFPSAGEGLCCFAFFNLFLGLPPSTHQSFISLYTIDTDNERNVGCEHPDFFIRIAISAFTQIASAVRCVRTDSAGRHFF
jgi:hypothetical protein